MDNWKKDMLKAVKMPFKVVSGQIVDNENNVIASMNRGEYEKRPLSPVQTDELAKELTRCFNLINEQIADYFKQEKH